MSSEATQSLTVYDALAWLETNKKNLILAFGAAVVIGFGIATYRFKVNQTELAASDALLKIKPPLGSSDAASQPSASEFIKIAEQYPGTAAGERASLLAAGALFSESKYAEAQAQFSKFVRERPQSPFAATAAYGVATCLEAEGKQDEALAAYQNLSVRFPSSSVLDDAKLATARIYEAKKQPDAALRIYEELGRVTSSGGMSLAASDAMSRKAELLARFPDLARTNVAAVPAPGTPTSTLVTKPAAMAPASAGTNAAPAKP